MRFVQKIITLQVKDTLTSKHLSITVQAWVCTRVGLAYHPQVNDPDRSFVVTHLASGLQVGEPIAADHTYAQQWIGRLATLTDFKRPAEEIRITTAQVAQAQALMDATVQQTLF